eukprot:6215291-Prymnesium_polylepis.1
MLTTAEEDIVLIDFGLAYRVRARRRGACAGTWVWAARMCPGPGTRARDMCPRSRQATNSARPHLLPLLRSSRARPTRRARCAWAAPASWRRRLTASSRATSPPMRSPLG